MEKQQHADDLDAKARALLPTLSTAERSLIGNGACDPISGGRYEHGRLCTLGIIATKHVAAEHAPDVYLRVYTFTDLGDAIADLLASTMAHSRCNDRKCVICRPENREGGVR